MAHTADFDGLHRQAHIENVAVLASNPGCKAIDAPRRSFRWRFPSAEHQASFFTTFYGPANRAVAALDEAGAAALTAEMVDLARRFDVSDDAPLVLRMDYLEVVVHTPDEG